MAAQTFQDASLTHRGPHPGVIAIVYTILFMAGLLLVGIASQGKAFPSPYNSLNDAHDALIKFNNIIKISTFLQFGSAVPLAIFSAAVTSRLKFLGVNVTGVSIAFAGGIAASIFMMISALCGWILTQPNMSDDITIMHTVQFFGFVCGGVAHVVTLGLLISGVAVPCLLGSFTPKWVAILGIILSIIAELSSFSLLFYPANFLLPVARFGSFVWMIATGFSLPASKK